MQYCFAGDRRCLPPPLWPLPLPMPWSGQRERQRSNAHLLPRELVSWRPSPILLQKPGATGKPVYPDQVEPRPRCKQLRGQGTECWPWSHLLQQQHPLPALHLCRRGDGGVTDEEVFLYGNQPVSEPRGSETWRNEGIKEDTDECTGIEKARDKATGETHD